MELGPQRNLNVPYFLLGGGVEKPLVLLWWRHMEGTQLSGENTELPLSLLVLFLPSHIRVRKILK